MKLSVLNEAFSVLPHSNGVFDINGNTYYVAFHDIELNLDEPTKCFEVRFSRKEDGGSKKGDQIEYSEITNDVDASDVYWTVADIVREHYEKNKSAAAMGYTQIAYYFRAARSDKDSEVPQRARIVGKIVKRYFRNSPDMADKIADHKRSGSEEMIILSI